MYSWDQEEMAVEFDRHRKCKKCRKRRRDRNENEAIDDLLKVLCKIRETLDDIEECTCEVIPELLEDILDEIKEPKDPCDKFRR